VRRARVGTARVVLVPPKEETEPDRLDEVLEGLLPDRELVVPELLPVVGREPLVERDDVFDEEDRDFDDFDGALATAVL
jgi:hypothetical protein